MSKARILPLIVLSQFFCTSLWFAGNAVIAGLNKDFPQSGNSFAHLASVVQFGFITGTLLYAVLALVDRFPPSKVFFFSALLAAFSNFAIVISSHNFSMLLTFRFLTGFFLAGIYPVGMKIASDHYGKDLGKVLGFLVGALVLGTAFPHLVKNYSGQYLWKTVFTITSALAIIGGTIVLFIPGGPYATMSTKIDLTLLFRIFRRPIFRSASFGYFGHMWELYTFWAFVPFMIMSWAHLHPEDHLNIAVLSFYVIAGGSIACITNGYLSQNYGAKKTAFVALLLSGLCCCVSPLMVDMPFSIFIAFLIFWGMVVIADSPMFSTMVAQNAPAESKGTALTIVTCIGFTITIVSVELLGYLQTIMNPRYLFLVLAPGPVFGLAALLAGRSKAA